MADTGIKLEGLGEVFKSVEKATERALDAAKTAIYGEQLALLELINRKEMVPVQTGRMKASAYVTPPAIVNGIPTSELGYGDKSESCDYMAQIHEDPTRRGETGRKGYKFLERAANIHGRAAVVRNKEAFERAFALGEKPESLAGIAPQTPQVLGEISRYVRKYGFDKEARRRLRAAAKRGHLKLVRRWKKPKRGGPNPRRKGV